MTSQDAETIEITAVSAGITILLDRRTGLLAGLRDPENPAAPGGAIRSSIRVTSGGEEERGAFGGLVYVDTVSAADSRLLDVDRERSGQDEVVTVRTRTGDVTLLWRYGLHAAAPRVRVDLEITADDSITVRDLELVLATPADADSGIVDVPGNRARPGLPLGRLVGRALVNTAGGTPGSSGLVVLGGVGGASFLVWPLAPQAIGSQWVEFSGGEFVAGIATGVAGALEPGGSLRYGPLYLDVRADGWSTFKAELADWYDAVGIGVPQDAPAWTGNTSIYEVQIGTSLFGGIADYSPYPEARDVLRDLDRIAELGFDTVQIMPRQPFPSYNVVDYDDIDTSYGDAEVIRELVASAHARGMKVILDVLMHGVLDKRSISVAADTVRRQPHGRFLQEHRAYSRAEAAGLPHAHQLPWSQHILDFEEAWIDGSPETHPLLAAHPEWFFRDSHGRTTGIYTWAFEAGDAGWQDYFRDVLIQLIERLGIDGFRFDAPTYNAFPDWSAATRAHASESELACIGLFARLRAQLKPRYPELMFYTEPSGVLLRQSMDVNYNYDEHAQLEDLMRVDGAALGAIGRPDTGVRHAHDLMRWLQDRNASLPRGAVTAHHIDSHDTFWWPRPGLKWRREQLGIEGAKALLSVFALAGGPYMTFVGGELGMEDHVRAIHRLRRRPEFALGTADFSAIRAEHPDVFTVTRRHRGRISVVIVNTRAVPVTTRLQAPDGWLPAACVDLLGDATAIDPTALIPVGAYQTIVLTESTGEVR